MIRSVSTGAPWKGPMKSRIVYEFLPSRTTEFDGDSGPYDVTIGQCFVSDRNPAFAILIRHKTLFNGEVKVCQLPLRLIGSDTVVRK